MSDVRHESCSPEDFLPYEANKTVVRLTKNGQSFEGRLGPITFEQGKSGVVYLRIDPYVRTTNDGLWVPHTYAEDTQAFRLEDLQKVVPDIESENTMTIAFDGGSATLSYDMALVKRTEAHLVLAKPRTQPKT